MKIKEIIINSFNIFSKLLILIIIIFLAHNKKMNNKNKIFQKNFKYYCCFCSMGKKENLYSRELISYYMSLGVEKFIFGDNNLLNTEKLSDFLQDYINNDTIDIIEIYGNPIDQAKFYGILYEKYKNKCEWLTFFDFDEYLVVHNEKGENILLKEYLSNPNLINVRL